MLRQTAACSLAALMAGALALGGCATTDSVKQAQATADHALSQAQAANAAAAKAQSSADAAGAAAQHAQATADAANSAAQTAASQAQATGQQVADMQARMERIGDLQPAPRPANCTIEVLHEAPTRPFVKVAHVYAHRESTIVLHPGLEEVLADLKKQACLAGAEGIMDIAESKSGYLEMSSYNISATAIVYR